LQSIELREVQLAEIDQLISDGLVSSQADFDEQLSRDLNRMSIGLRGEIAFAQDMRISGRDLQRTLSESRTPAFDLDLPQAQFAASASGIEEVVVQASRTLPSSPEEFLGMSPIEATLYSFRRYDGMTNAQLEALNNSPQLHSRDPVMERLYREQSARTRRALMGPLVGGTEKLVLDITGDQALANQAAGLVLEGLLAKGLSGGELGRPPRTPARQLKEPSVRESAWGNATTSTLEPRQAGQVVPNAFNASEAAFASEIVAYRGGTLTGAPERSFPGTDGKLNGSFISLKETQGGLSAVLKHASKAETQAKNAGYSGVDLYIEAPNVQSTSLQEFASKGGLSAIPNQGTISKIYVQTKDGWVVIGGARK